MPYDRKLEKLQKFATLVERLVASDDELRLKVMNTEDNEEDGFSMIVVVKFEPRGKNEII